MRAYKFLSAGAIGLYSGFEWPTGRDGEPGRWVEAAGDLRSGVNGIHACLPADLPYWIDDELWEIELDGEVFADHRGLLARRGRLVRRLEGWNPETANAFAAACAERARELARGALADWDGPRGRIEGYVRDVACYAADVSSDVAWAACTAYVEAYLAGYLATGARGRPTDAPEFGETRRTQAAWLVVSLRLSQAESTRS